MTPPTILRRFPSSGLDPNWSKKLDTSTLYEVGNVHEVVAGLHSSSDWISLETHQMSPPTIL